MNTQQLEAVSEGPGVCVGVIMSDVIKNGGPAFPSITKWGHTAEMQWIDRLRTVISGGMLDFERAVRIANLLVETSTVPGDIVEFGCHLGHTSALMTVLSNKQVWCYDSFEGLPAPTTQDGTNTMNKGELAVTVEQFLEAFNGIRQPKVVKGWFKDITNQLPEKISFAHLDGDFYDSIRDSLALVYPRLSAGAVCVVDDFEHERFPGVQLAVQEFSIAYRCTVSLPTGLFGTPSLHCVIRK